MLLLCIQAGHSVHCTLPSPETGSVQHGNFSEKALLKDSMRSSLMLLHIVGAFEHFETLWALCWFSVHVLNSDVSRQVYTRYQLSAMRAGLLAWNEFCIYILPISDTHTTATFQF